jgi:NADPH2:quinone reductase
MLEAVVHPLPTLTSTIHSVPIPVPKPTEVLIKVVAAGSNQKDWIHPTAINISINSGDDMAGTVHAIGSAVQDFRIGDRVAAFHHMGSPGGAYAEYAIAPAHTTFHIPPKLSFEEACTIPLVALTAAISLFRRQGLLPPWSIQSSTQASNPLIIYGGSSALGFFSLKLAALANIHPLIVISGGSLQEDINASLDPSKGDAFVDYRTGVEAFTKAVSTALNGHKAHHAIDTISSNKTWVPLSHMLDPDHNILSVFSGREKYDEPDIAPGVDIVYTFVGTGHDGAYLAHMPKQPRNASEVKDDVEFARIFFQYLTQALTEGRLTGHPYQVMPGGLNGIAQSLQNLKGGKTGGKKIVALIRETPALN